MKNHICTLLFAFLFNSLQSQLPVSTLPQNKKVVLEHFTGLQCGWSPQGDSIASAIVASNPANIVLVQIHQGPYATPSAGQPNLTVTAGSAIGNMPAMNITGWPQADINRSIMPAYSANSVSPYGMAINRFNWSAACNSILSQSAYCNVALQGTIDVATRILTVEAQVYYTASSPAPNNSLTIVLLEDSIHGPVANFGNYNSVNYNADGSYNHNRVLRATITPTFGTSIPATGAGSTFSISLTYSVPQIFGIATYTNLCQLGRLRIAAFVTESNSLTVNAANGPLALSGFTNSLDLSVNNLGCDESLCEGTGFNSNCKIFNYGSSTVTTAVLSYSMNGLAAGNFTWNGIIPPYQLSQTFTLPTFSFNPSATNTLELAITSVNGAADQNNLNNLLSKVVAQTSVMANSVNMQMNFVQDRWGSECRWKIIEESSNTIVVQDGPFADLPANLTQLHSKSFILQPNTCYKLMVSDTYGDGINAGFGSGNYSLLSGGNTVFYSNGVYGKGENKWFRTSIAAGMDTQIPLNNKLVLYPNPAGENCTIQISHGQNEIARVSVYNNLGQLMDDTGINELKSGMTEIKLKTASLPKGIYTVVVKFESSSVQRKLLIE